MKLRTLNRRRKQLQNAKMYLAKVVDLEDEIEHYPDQYPFHEGDTVIVLGEVEQMPDHVVIALKDGRVLFGYHVWNFERIPMEEA